MPTNLKELEDRLWQAADNLRANSKLSSYEYSTPVLGLIFLRYAWHRFQPLHEELEGQSSGRRTIGPADYKAEGVLYLPEQARYNYLLQLPESEDIGQKVNEAMEAIEEENPELADVLPKDYKQFEDRVLKDLLKNFSNVGADVEGDVFGQIYEYFLGKFAMSEGQKGGEFFTPTAIVKLIVEVLEPYGGKILDPACGSGGMFVQSDKFRNRHQKNGDDSVRTRHGVSQQAKDILSIYGQENKENTVRLCKMNLAVHGLEGDIRTGNTYYENAHDCVGRFDYVMANPPFNVSGVDKEAIEGDPRYPFGIPSTDNANYLWMQEFFSALNDSGRAGFVMANSAADARHSEQEIRRKLIEEGVVDVIISVGSNFFYTVTLPCTLWFFDKGKQQLPEIDIEDVRTRHGVSPQDEEKGRDEVSTRGCNTVLFIDARNIYRQLDRAHRDFTDRQLDFIANIVRRYRGEELDSVKGDAAVRTRHGVSQQAGNEEMAMAAEEAEEYQSVGPYHGTADEDTQSSNITQPDNMYELFDDGQYRDIPGLCKVATVEEIEEQGWSLNPGRYVGVAEREEDDVDFQVRLGELYEELELLNAEADSLENQITENIQSILNQ
ncbi:N-6 DNA methylase [Halalkalibaculum sp. DA3122]|uniref:type I restriction-modification system subunit M n=1 Tax=unclassified Halalkalibaculum TaxID=2964617 RepID=UPI003754CB5E